MKYLAAYALVALSGKTPSEQDVQAVLKAAGAPVDAARIQLLFTELKDKNFEEVCNEGKAKLVGCGSGSGSAPAAAAGGSAPAAETKAAAKEESEDDDEMGFGLFD
eukprot:gene5482-3956_t